MKKTFVCMMVVFALVCGTAWASGPVVIVNEGVDVASLDSKALRYIFLGKKTSWNGNGRIVPVALEVGPVHKQFLKTYVRKTPSQFSTHWKRMTFTGKAEEIRTFRSEADLVSFVASHPGAIGYVSSSASVQGAKVLTVQ